MASSPTIPESVIFYDSECALCNGFVAWIILKDKRRRFQFASLAGQTARQLDLSELGLSPHNGSGSVVLRVGSDCYLRSDAVLRILSGLGGIYRVTVVLRILPCSFRDWIYDQIAKRRTILGDNAHCQNSDEGSRDPKRFLP